MKHFTRKELSYWIMSSDEDSSLDSTSGSLPQLVSAMLSSLDLPSSLLALAVTLLVGLVTFLVVVRVRAARESLRAVKDFVAPGKGPRFRKRDRLAFMSRRALRNARAVGSYIRGGQGRKRRDVARLVRKVFLQRWERA